eukprot:TRINITY_DN11946_c0_g1_i4.p1 TRINITY_DN11946_c0_g1~~TRINITY_DN11946_c0_g1_i4.p1  ORF type:complete len:144 (+),score=60.16 TRINITY_DN11946_c0_g1_i4:94-525(+)
MSCDVRVIIFFFFLMIRRPPRSTLSSSSAASDVYKRQVSTQSTGDFDAAWVMGCTMADEQVGGQEKEKRGIVTDKEVVRLFQKIGDPSGGTRKVDVVNMSQVAAWLRLSLIHISEPTRLLSISYAVFCLKKKKKKINSEYNIY